MEETRKGGKGGGRRDEVWRRQGREGREEGGGRRWEGVEGAEKRGRGYPKILHRLIFVEFSTDFSST